MIFPKFSNFRILTDNDSIEDYNQFLLREINHYQAMGEIKDVKAFKEMSKEFWDNEKKNTNAHPFLESLFQRNAKVLNKYLEVVLDKRLSNTRRGKKLQTLKTAKTQMETYEKVAFQNAIDPSSRVNFQTFDKLLTMKAQEFAFAFKGTDEELKMERWDHMMINKLVKEVQDTSRHFFTSIPGFREEINEMLQGLVKLNVPDVYDNDQQQNCESFGSHQIFRMYAKQIQECMARVENEIDAVKQKDYELKLLRKRDLVFCNQCEKQVQRQNRGRHVKQCCGIIEE
jgi:hypothetical protein